MTRYLELHIVDRNANLLMVLPKGVIVNTMSWTLKDVGEADFDISAYNPVAGALKGWEHEVQIWLKDDNETNFSLLLWWGVLWRRKGSPGIVNWICEDLRSLFKKRIIDGASAEFTSEIQEDIIWGLVEYAQDPAGLNGQYKDLNIVQTLVWPITGRRRSRIYERNTHEVIFELLQEFFDLEDGCDWSLDIFEDGRREINVHYPQKGVDRRNIIRLEYGIGISTYEITDDHFRQSNDTYNVGGSNGDIQMEGHATEHFSANEVGLMQEVISDSSMLDPIWLQDGASKHARTHKDGVQTVDIGSVNISIDYLSLVEPGDSIYVIIDDGANQFRGLKRINKITWNPGEQLDGEIVLEFDENTTDGGLWDDFQRGTVFGVMGNANTGHLWTVYGGSDIFVNNELIFESVAADTQGGWADLGDDTVLDYMAVQFYFEDPSAYTRDCNFVMGVSRDSDWDTDLYYVRLRIFHDKMIVACRMGGSQIILHDALYEVVSGGGGVTNPIIDDQTLYVVSMKVSKDHVTVIDPFGRAYVLNQTGIEAALGQYIHVEITAEDSVNNKDVRIFSVRAIPEDL